jgi:hypothetical protein
LDLPDVDVAVERQRVGAFGAVAAEIPGACCAESNYSSKEKDDFLFHGLGPWPQFESENSSSVFITNNPLAPSFPRRRESSKKNNPRSGQSLGIDPLCGDFSINWIPAAACPRIG